MKGKNKIPQNDKTMGAYSAPVIQQSGVTITSNGELGQIERSSQKFPNKLKGETAHDNYMEHLEKVIKHNFMDSTTELSMATMRIMASTDTSDEEENDDDDDDDDGDYEYNN